MLVPAGPAPRLFAGGDQPSRRPLGLDEIRAKDRRIPVTTHEVQAGPFHAVVDMARTDRRALPIAIVVPPISGHFALLMRDLVAGLLCDFRVWLIDWVNARHVPVERGDFGLDDNIRAVEAAARAAGPGAGIVGVCQGGVPALAATALMAAEGGSVPRALALIAAPVDPLVNPTRLVTLARQHPLDWFERRASARVPGRFAGRGRRVYPAAAQGVALSAYFARRMWPGTELWRKTMRDDGEDPARFPFLDLYGSVMDIDARHYVENIARIYHARALAEGRLACGERQVEPAAIRETALLTVEGARDDIAAPGQTDAAHRLCPALPECLRDRLLLEGAGHFSLFHGKLYRNAVLPALRRTLLREAG